MQWRERNHYMPKEGEHVEVNCLKKMMMMMMMMMMIEDIGCLGILRVPF